VVYIVKGLTIFEKDGQKYCFFYQEKDIGISEYEPPNIPYRSMAGI
jgi:hypothetical protein